MLDIDGLKQDVKAEFQDLIVEIRNNGIDFDFSDKTVLFYHSNKELSFKDAKKLVTAIHRALTLTALLDALNEL